MKKTRALASTAIAIVIVTSGVLAATPYVFAGRVAPGLTLAGKGIAGLPHENLAPIIRALEESLREQTVTLQVAGQRAEATVGELGVSIDQDATIAAIAGATPLQALTAGGDVTPRLAIDARRLAEAASRHFPQHLTPPQDASLNLSSPEPLALIPSRRGQRIDEQQLKADLQSRLGALPAAPPITVRVITTVPAVEDHEVESARAFTGEILAEGLRFSFDAEEYVVTPATARRLLTFIPALDPDEPANQILGVAVNADGFADYLQKTLAPEINQEAQDARFTLEQGGDGFQRVTQFAVPEQGRNLDISRTISHAQVGLARGERTIPLAVDVVNPVIATSDDITQLGITTRLAQGESDFAGSPKNRIHNITVGTERYHGLLLAPGEEFSFNKFLGPVDGAHGFVPELVIKNNVTTPEFGGGLCQVSTTAFRAALNAGLEITSRRNHAYAVRYYGTPGLDATIYPPATDLTFANNTPGYILMQTRIEGTKLFFEFWGTNDGREVQLTGPMTYDRQPDGAVKAYVEQKVTRAGETIIDETFYSRYKSPKLFPKVLAANGEQN